MGFVGLLWVYVFWGLAFAVLVWFVRFRLWVGVTLVCVAFVGLIGRLASCLVGFCFRCVSWVGCGFCLRCFGFVFLV